ncbi:FecCD family ABC transporter permease [Ideonella sp.]|uniref:FecCD family ABC transporter permease n=1 Tax=Ideonella sp. TaxID=1929293 RepID=UPI0035AE2CAA
METPGRTDAARRRRLLLALAGLAIGLALLGLAAGPSGLSWPALVADAGSDQAMLILGQIRAPRTLGAWGVGALLGLAGAIAQGLFRNPLADPYLLGTAAGASLAVVLLLAGASLGGLSIGLATAQWLARLGMVLAAFVGALGGLMLTLMLARGAQAPMRLLLAGVVVAVVLGAASDLVTTVSPEALRGKQSFMLGSTGFLGWGSVWVLAVGLAVALPLARRYARALDALTLGEDSAASLGLDLPRIRLVLVGLLALATGLAVSQAGLVAFVGLAAPHLVRRHAPAPQAFTLLASAAMGGVLLLAADVLARSVIAPQELPVGVLTAVIGGAYLMRLLKRQSSE